MSFLDKLRQKLHAERVQREREVAGLAYIAELVEELGIPDTVDTIDIVFHYDDGEVLFMRTGRLNDTRSDSSGDEK